MKAPLNLPTVGDYCKLRGKQSCGKVVTINPKNNWAYIEWIKEETPSAPKMCHLFELEKVERK